MAFAAMVPTWSPCRYIHFLIQLWPPCRAVDHPACRLAATITLRGSGEHVMHVPVFALDSPRAYRRQCGVRRNRELVVFRSLPEAACGSRSTTCPATVARRVRSCGPGACPCVRAHEYAVIRPPCTLPTNDPQARGRGPHDCSGTGGRPTRSSGIAVPSLSTVACSLDRCFLPTDRGNRPGQNVWHEHLRTSAT